MKNIIEFMKRYNLQELSIIDYLMYQELKENNFKCPDSWVKE
jgi:hypothetical protein